MLIESFENVQKFKFLPSDTCTNDVRIREMQYIAQFLPANSTALEFGVFKGITINALANARSDLEIHGFDSFEGLPEDWDTGEKYIKKEQFDVQGIIPEVPDNVTLHKGWFDKTVYDYAQTLYHDTDFTLGKTISFINIDSDLYSSASTVLSCLTDFIGPGTIIRFDELCCWRSVFKEATPHNIQRVFYSKWPEGEFQALCEWILQHNRRVMPISRNWFQSGTFVVTQ